LICRYRPRALPKAKETWDEWDKNLGPSGELLAELQGKHGDPIKFSEFAKRYRSEMNGQAGRIEELARRAAAGETITLLCSSGCVDETRCHRSVLKRLIEARTATKKRH
jgi:uncharacterized protein YeaO (DUF488 family)